MHELHTTRHVRWPLTAVSALRFLSPSLQLLPPLRSSSVSASDVSHASDLSVEEEAAIALLPTDEERAAAKIQALARGQLVRKQQKDQQLWQAWNELDWVRGTHRHTHTLFFPPRHATL